MLFAQEKKKLTNRRMSMASFGFLTRNASLFARFLFFREFFIRVDRIAQLIRTNFQFRILSVKSSGFLRRYAASHRFHEMKRATFEAPFWTNVQSLVWSIHETFSTLSYFFRVASNSNQGLA
jgi:hypothetical protein